MRRTVTRTLIGLAGLAAAAAAALAYETRQLQKLPLNHPAEFVKKGRASAGQQVVVCLGASIVHGRVSVDFVDLLRGRFPSADYTFVNAGLNGDLAYNALQRLDDVIACDPDAVIVLVGTNDVTASLDERVRRNAIRYKKLPVEPTPARYVENMSQIVDRLQGETRARVALCSLPVLGEDVASPANRRTDEFNAALKQIAQEKGAAYLPVHERQVQALARVGREHGRAYNGLPLLVVAAGAQRYLLGQSLDGISRRNGLVLTTDLLHLNTRGALIVADEIEAFLCGRAPA